MKWLEKLRNKSNFKGIPTGRGYSKNEWNKLMRTRFTKRHGDGPAGLDYAKSYQYNPNLGERFLDALPLVGGKRDYNRTMDYIDRVHDDPNENERAEKEFQKRAYVTGKTQQYSSSTNNTSHEDRFSSGNLVSSDDPTVYGSSRFASENNTTKYDQFISGNRSGHQVYEDNTTKLAMDPYNIAVPKQGRTVLGVPIGYSGKITSNVAEGGGSKLDPYINTETLKSQVMRNKNLAIGTSNKR
jgi:hypothetical protein